MNLDEMKYSFYLNLLIKLQYFFPLLMFDKGIVIFKRFRYIYFLMDFKNSVKVNKYSSNIVMPITLTK
jgi:hypothetical protein